VVDTVAGQAQVFFSAGTQTLPHANAGRLRLLAVTEGRRSPLLPDVPTVGETLPGYEMAVWYGCFGPAGMPTAVTARLNAEINRVLALPEVTRRMAEIGVEVQDAPPGALGTLLRADAEKWGGLIRQLGIVAE
jgi:tripartite-type tricarboxylate transporter receptor subunit TctC